MKQSIKREKQLTKLRKLCQSFAGKVKDRYGLKAVICEITDYDISVTLYSPKGNIFLGSMIANVHTLDMDSVDGILGPVEPLGTLFAECSDRFGK
jgi:hypothetical protein